ncbi:hypothetical protein KKF84_03515 [Myxococcota bacterium]|nr:hypothetical protein [Myxococcota bacterium]
MKHITPFIIFGLLWCLPGAVHAQEVPFPGMSPQGYYASVAHFLRNPMVKDGVIIGENFERRDKSLFSDSFYADVVLYGKGPGGALSGGTVGATWQFPYGYVYGLVTGFSYYEQDAAQGYGLVGGGIRKKLWKFFDLNVYGQASFGAMTPEGENRFYYEVGGYPINHRLVQSSLHAFFKDTDVTWFENRTRVAFLGLGYWENREIDVRRSFVNISRRSLAIFADSMASSTWEAELELATLDLPAARDRIWETRLKLFFSTVGDGPKGEARPGIHLNLSYVSENGSDYEGFGVELGFGAKQLDSNRSQELYFVVFYNYSAWFYRLPSLKWGIGLTGRI